MKKILVVLAVMCLVSTLSFARAKEDQEFIIKTGVQPQGTWSDDTGDENSNVGISAGIEYFKYFNNIVAIGGGVSYDLPREFREGNNVENLGGTMSFIPFYAAVKVRMPLQGLENNYPFATAKLGYSAFMNDIDFIRTYSGGLHAGISAGYCIGALFVEASYSINTLSYRPIAQYDNTKDYSATYSTIAVYIGVKMD
jgi:hypothetical protein